MTSYTIDFEPLGRRGECSELESVLDCARRLGVGMSSVCGGAGTCGKCKIKIISGRVSSPTQKERDSFSINDISSGWRFACQVFPSSDVKIHIPIESMTTVQRTQFEGVETPVSPEPAVKCYEVKLSPPSLHDLQSDADRVVTGLNQQHNLKCSLFDFRALQTLSAKLRDGKWHLDAVVRSKEVIDVFPHPTRCLGLAVDLGTTKIAGYLVDLDNGKTLAAKGVMNPQISYGEDVISRIATAVSSPQKTNELQNLVVTAINQMANELCSQVTVKTQEIVEAVVVANTAMHHLFLALPVKQLANHPYVPAIGRAIDVKARDLGLKFSAGAYVHLLPNIAGFVGADHVAMLLATEIKQAQGPLISIDIGTNTEVSLLYKRRITAVSCASGPAFEGGCIKDGMRAASGAIERVQIAKDKVEYQTIDDTSPVGICGSGILDTMAQMLLAGIIDKSGRMQKDHSLVRTGDSGLEFVLVKESGRDGHPSIVFTQRDVRQLQLGKAAIRTGIQMLLEANDCREEEIKRVNIAGAFGSYIDVSSAIDIGMLPSLPLDRFVQVGNAAGMGAKQALISLNRRKKAISIAAGIRYIELAAMPDFNRTFAQTMYLGRYRLKQGKREEIKWTP